MEAEPVITVTPMIVAGTVVRWYHSTDDNERPVLSASREGVMIHGDVFWHDIPREWLNRAKDAHEMLKLSGGKRDVGHFATHKRRGLTGPLEPVGGSGDPKSWCGAGPGLQAGDSRMPGVPQGR
jgi:hypothetical protein